MLIMLIKKISSFFFSNFLVSCATYKPYSEGIYLSKATTDLVEKALSAASKIGYKGVFEVSIVEKAGIEINPYNKFISKALNPVTKNNLIIVNPDWFNGLSEKEQEYFLVNTFAHFLEPALYVRYVKFLKIFLTIIVSLVFMTILSYGRFAISSEILRLPIFFGLVMIFNFVFLNRIVKYIARKFDSNYQRKIDNLVLTVIDKDVFIKSIKILAKDFQSIKDEGPAFAIQADLFILNLPDRIKNIN